MWKEEESKRFCDECGKEVKPFIELGRKWRQQCEYCGKDLCNECVEHNDGEEGIYRKVYCKECWEIGEVYRQRLAENTKERYSLYSEWMDKCKSKRRGK